MPRKDLAGMKFGELTALRYVREQSGKGSCGRWECVCTCGKMVRVRPGNLMRGNSTSCGCKLLRSKKYNFVDLAGKKFGALLVEGRLDKYTKTRGALWRCRCDCGKELLVPSNSLTSGNTVTCGSRTKHYISKREGEIPLSHIVHIKNNATKRSLSFTVTPSFLWDLFLKQERKCSLSGVPLAFAESSTCASRRKGTTASLDRIDSDRGYDMGNVRWVHKDVNRIRWDLDDETFLDWCRKCVLQHDMGVRPGWDEYFLRMAMLVATKSKDRSTKVGAVLVGQDHSIISTGFNGFPRGINDDVESRHQRPAKLLFTSHAEVNSVTNAVLNGVRTAGATLYLASFPVVLPPCADCARVIIQSGIVRVVYAKVDVPDRWKEQCGVAAEMFKESGVAVCEV